LTRPRILLINPNTSGAATDRMLALARAAAGDKAHVRGVTAPFGARTIVSGAEAAIAAHAVLVAAARHLDRVDAVIDAAFIDPGLEALRDLAGKPCVGLCEAAMLEAAEGGRRFGVATGGAHLDTSLRGLAARYGVADRLVDIAFLEAPLGAVAGNPEAYLRAFQTAVERLAKQGARAVLIGGGPLSGIAGQLKPPRGVAIVDGIQAAVRRAIALLGQPVPPAQPGNGRYRAVDPDLVRLLKQKPRRTSRAGLRFDAEGR